MHWTIAASHDIHAVALKFAAYLEELGLRQGEEYDFHIADTDPGTGHRIVLGCHDSSTPEEYRIKAENVNGCNVITVTGSDRSGLLYGWADFVNRYIPHAENTDSTFPYYFRPVFFTDDPIRPYERVSSPKIARRGCWTWGHVIRDPGGYFENMVKCKMNTCVIWNNHVPTNAREIVRMAHENGIRLLWGYAWGWSTNINAETMQEHLNRRDEVVREYLDNYAPLGADGIYFQSFTETSSETLGGRLIAEVVTEYVNDIAGKILAVQPDLHIQFGLHASSVRQRLAYIAKVDPRIEIVWEDCGAFPFAYIPKNTDNADATMDIAREMSTLRGRDDRFGCVYKGLCCLNWTKFSYPPAPYAIGSYAALDPMPKYLAEKRKIWHYVQAHWLKTAEVCRAMTEMLMNEKNGELTILALVEDSAFEFQCWFPVLLLGEILWDPTGDIGEMIRDVSLSPYAVFA
ncbi:MAG: hypothetical protein IJY35_03125 [Clostridia bacterium]|nr:hypothetical protein [Clostridia bacterium]